MDSPLEAVWHMGLIRRAGNDRYRLRRPRNAGIALFVAPGAPHI
jgi:hypothetical protein